MNSFLKIHILEAELVMWSGRNSQLWEPKLLENIRFFGIESGNFTKVGALVGYRDQKCQRLSLGLGFSEPNPSSTTPSLTTRRKVYAVSYITTSPPTPPHIQ